MLGPLGRPFEVDPRSQHLLLVAGGLGIAGVRLLADEAIRAGRQVTLLFGAASAREVYPSTLLPDEVEYVVATDDGSLGHHGPVTDLVPDYEAWADQAFACGPRAMLAALARLAAGRRERLGVAKLGRKRGAGRSDPAGSPAARRKAFLQVSMEQNMGCAVGACLGCVVMGASGGPAAGLSRGPGLRRRGARLGERMVSRRRSGKARSASASMAGPVVATPRAPAGIHPDDVDLSVDLGRGLVLPNPVMVAAGTFGYGVEYAEATDIDRLGGISTRGTTLKARPGNLPPRMALVPGGLLNSVGLQNPGIDAVIERYASIWATWRTPVLLNLAGTSVRDYVELARRLDGVPGVAGIELNLSCADADAGGMPFAVDAAAAGRVTAAVRRATDLPLLVKLSPDVTDIRPIARAIADAGADALAAINTVAGLAVAPGRRRPLLGTTYGGLTGPAIRPIALRIVHEVAQVVKIPVIAIGGITDLADVLDYLAVGAVAVQVGTANFVDPTLPVRLVDELAVECGRRAAATYRDLIGIALPPEPGHPPARGLRDRR